MKPTVNIIGGGIAGISLALTLQQKGLPYVLFEKNHALTYDEVGLGISANVFPILKSWGVYDDTASVGAFIKQLHFVNKDFDYLKTFNLKHPALSVRRSAFYDILTSKISQENVLFNQDKKVQDFKTSEVVIGADGMHSAVRKAICPKLDLRNSNQLLWRGISQLVLPEEFKNAYHDFIALNLRFAIIHTGEDYYSWYLIKEYDKHVDKAEQTKEDLKDVVKDLPKVTHEIIDHSRDIYFSALQDIKPSARNKMSWYSGNRLLIGDAIHPTTPNMANGACLSMEDGFLLANLLASSQTVEEAFKTFQQEREPKVNRVVSQSWLFGKAMHWNNKLMTYGVEQAVRLTPGCVFDQIYSGILNEGKLLPTMYDHP